MWPKIEFSDYYCCYNEPIELRKLKHKLACLSCNCGSCKKSSKSRTDFPQTQKDQQVQVQESKKKLSHQYTQASPQGITNAHEVFMNTITKEVLCPSCFVTMSLLRGGMLRVVKDEQVEANIQMVSPDRSIVRYANVTNKSTSYYENSQKFSALTMCDLLTEVDSDDALNVAPQDKQHLVKFVDSEKDSQKIDNCMCLDKFINSIRPPLGDFLFE